jgi:hypothetical protein
MHMTDHLHPKAIDCTTNFENISRSVLIHSSVPIYGNLVLSSIPTFPIPIEKKKPPQNPIPLSISIPEANRHIPRRAKPNPTQNPMQEEPKKQQNKQHQQQQQQQQKRFSAHTPFPTPPSPLAMQKNAFLVNHQKNEKLTPVSLFPHAEAEVDAIT